MFGRKLFQRLLTLLLLSLILLLSTGVALAGTGDGEDRDEGTTGSATSSARFELPARAGGGDFVGPNANQGLPGGYAWAKGRLAWKTGFFGYMDARAVTGLSGGVVGWYMLGAKVDSLEKNGVIKCTTPWIERFPYSGGGKIAAYCPRDYGNPSGDFWRLRTSHRVVGGGVDWRPHLVVSKQL